MSSQRSCPNEERRVVFDPDLHEFLEDAALENVDSDKVAIHFSKHFTDSDGAAVREKAIRYVAETLNRIDSSLAADVITSPHFSNALTAMTTESLFLPERQVPIAVDLPLRFEGVDPERVDRIFSAYQSAIAAEDRPSSEIRAEELLLFLAWNPRTPSAKYIDSARLLLDEHFSRLSADQMNRVFHETNAVNIEWLADRADALIATAKVATLVRMLLVAAAHLPDRVGIIREAISSAAPAEERTVSTTRHWIRFDTAAELTASSPTRWRMQRPRRRRARPRLALCISGQLRGYERAWPTWRRALRLDDVDLRVFVSTWQRIGGKQLNAAHMYRYYPKELADAIAARWLEVGERQFRAEFPALCALAESGGSITPSELERLYRTPDVIVHRDEIFPPGCSNSERMHFKIESAWSLAMNSGEEFDLMMRIRPDKELESYGNGVDWHALSDSVGSGRIAYSDFAPRLRRHQGNSIGDQILLASPATAQILHRPYSIANALSQSGGAYVVPPSFRAHATLGGIALLAGIDVRRMPGLVLSDRQLLNPATPTASMIRDALQSDRTERNATTADRFLAVLNALQGRS